jgi:hypothetical protein
LLAPSSDAGIPTLAGVPFCCWHSYCCWRPSTLLLASSSVQGFHTVAGALC